jgi:hypothetical protein
MSKWQGISAAVNAHLERLAQANRGILIARKISDNGGRDINEALLRQHVANEWGWRWAIFGASYGYVGEDGKPQVVAGVREGQTISGREQFSAGDAAINQGANLAVREHTMLTKATTHYVSGNVIDEVTLAANLAEPEPLFDTDLFTPYGFAVLERPIVMPDLDPNTGLVHPHVKVYVRAIGWCYEEAIFSNVDNLFHPGVSIFLYTTADDYTEGFYRTSIEAGFDETYPPENVAVNGLIPIEVIPWCFGVNWQPRDVSVYTPGTVPIPIAQERRWFMAFMRLCWQEIIVRHAVHADRPTNRRWDRMAKGKLLDFSILRLRREVDPNYRPPHVSQGTLTYRQFVRGTWKRVHLSSLGPARLADGRMDPYTHRLKWIEAYWRGPEDGEEGPTHKATSVTR